MSKLRAVQRVKKSVIVCQAEANLYSCWADFGSTTLACSRFEMGIAEKSLGILSVALTFLTKWEGGVERERGGRQERLTVSHTWKRETVLTLLVWLGTIVCGFETIISLRASISPIGMFVSQRGFGVCRIDPFQRTWTWKICFKCAPMPDGDVRAQITEGQGRCNPSNHACPMLVDWVLLRSERVE